MHVDSLCWIKGEHAVDQVVELLAQWVRRLYDCLSERMVKSARARRCYSHSKLTSNFFICFTYLRLPFDV